MQVETELYCLVLIIVLFVFHEKYMTSFEKYAPTSEKKKKNTGIALKKISNI